MFPLPRCLPPLLLSAACLVSCSTPTAPEPAEFSQSTQQLKRNYARQKQLGIASLHGAEITSTLDAQGQPAYLATGGAVLVKGSVPAITAKAPAILLTKDYAELRGRSVVKKQGMLHTGDAAGSKIIIDGVFLRFEGPHSEKRPAAASEPEPGSGPGVVPASAPAPSLVPAPGRPTGSVMTRNTGSTVPKLSPPPARVVRAAPAKPAPTKPKPATPKAPSKPAAASPGPAKPAPLDRTKALQLMREPGDG